ncbi:ABC transporter permease [Paenibacillus protaetiae]|uniref:Iron ABC transporter permease n=1 Tax=Paenibacillus protaetiae TaxID=2509456 RepID=A0A4P6ETA5_9BACL|nr:iron ABC transporter permease [Paenibacillus protaetiae]QAY65273.1 iron ABC transporter permease [Paenibacillus protaetiae]
MSKKQTLALRRTRLYNLSMNWLRNPVHLIGIAAILFLAYMIAWPVLKIAYTTFVWQQQDVRLTGEANPGHFTLYHWTRVLGSDMSVSLFYKPIMNSLAVGAAVSALSMVLGCGLAWLVTRTNIPLKKTITFLAVIPYLLPAWILSQAWLTFFKNGKIGGTPGILQSLLHVAPPDWISYGFVPIVFSLSMHDSVFFFLIVGAALSSMNSQLEEAASVAGARRLTVLRKIVFPLVMPSMLSGFILIFTKAISSYGVPALLGSPVNFYMISTMLYSSMRSRLTTEANVLSLALILISVATIYLNQRVAGSRRSYVTVTGKDSARTLTELGRWKYPAAGAAAVLMAMIAVVPLLVLLLQSFMLKEGQYHISNLTMHYWWGGSDPDINTGEKGVLRNDTFMLAIKNSLFIAAASAVLSAVIGLILGYVVSRGKHSWIGRVVDQASFLPYLIPGVSLAAIYISMFAKPALLIPALYGTITLLILITVVKELPFTVKAGSASMMQIGKELEEAAQVGGASWFARFRRILLPLNRKSLMSAFLLVFIGAMKEMELIIMLVTPRTETLTTLTFYYAEKGYEQLTNVILMIIIAIVIAVYLIAVKWGKADLTQGIGGS